MTLHQDEPQLNQEVDGLSKANRNLREISRKSSRGTRASMVFLTLVIAFSLSASGYALYDRIGSASSQATQQEILNQRFKNADARAVATIRTILCLATRQSQTSRQRTPEEKRESARFYAEALRSIHAKPCPPIK